MRVLVAGATSVPGIPLLRELNARGHEVVGLTRSSDKTPAIEAAGAKPVVADVFDTVQLDAVLGELAPEVVVSLLTTLPKWGPKRFKDFEPATKLWSRGAANLVAAAQRAGVRRVVAESVIFAYGYAADRPGTDGRERSVSRPAAARWRRDAGGAAGYGTDRAVVRRAQRHRGNRVALRHFLRSGCAARRVVHPTGEVVGDARDDRHRTAVLDRDRRCRPCHRRRPRPGPGRTDLQHCRRPAAVVRRLQPRAGRETAPAATLAAVVSAGRPGRSVPGGAFGRAWLPLSNAKAKAELGWAPVTRL